MGRDLELSCRCGQVRGTLRGVSPDVVNRVLCYCDDCQAFAHHLERADLLDAHGGSDIVQVAPAALWIEHGLEQVTGVRLNPKGLYRWYASCCRTPLGNTMSPTVPFVGLVREAVKTDDFDAALGPVRASLLGKFAIGNPPNAANNVNLPFLARTLRLILSWKLRGKTWPHPYFDRGSRAPIKPVTTLSTSERDALRRLCGPQPARTSGAISS